MASVMRVKEIKKTRNRKAKLKKLRGHYAAAKTENVGAAILSKVRKVAPWLSEEEFLAPLKK